MKNLTQTETPDQAEKQNARTHLQKKYAVQPEQVQPLSHNQRAMWLVQQLEPDNISYNIGVSLHISSAIDVQTLRDALQAVTDRHSTYRTTYDSVNGHPFQIVLERQSVDFEAVDATNWSNAQLVNTIQNTLDQPFDLTHDNMLRSRLYIRDENQFVIQIVNHHISADGWSAWILLHDLQQAYEIRSANQSVTLPKLSFQYSDFVTWQSDMLVDRGEQLWSFWREELSGGLTALTIPTDYNGFQKQKFAGASHPFVFDENVAVKLRQLAHEEESTLYKTLLTAFQVFLWRYSGQEDILIGTPVLGRSHKKFLQQIGYFVNTVVMRGQIDPHRSFRQQLQITNKKVKSALEHADFPFSSLVKRLQPARKLSHMPLTQVLFNVLRPPTHLKELVAMAFGQSDKQSLPLGMFTTTALDIETGQQIEDFGLNLDVLDLGDRLIGYFKYSANLYESESIARMVEHLQVLLSNIVANPDRPILELSMISAVEQQKMLTEWSETAVTTPPSQTIHQLFEEQAAKTPNATAVVSGNEQISYAELNQRANQLARHLQAMGVRSETIIGIFLERSPDMIIAMLGVLKAGGAYLPLDPAYPAERLAFMLADVQPTILLTIEPLLDGLHLYDLEQQPISLCFDRDRSDVEQHSGQNLTSNSDVNHLAYVIYTSGSTGKPKGVMVPHRAVVNYTRAAIDAFELSVHDRVLQFASFSFDTAAEEIVPTLASGAALVLRPESMIDDVSAFLNHCAMLQLTVIDLPTAYWHDLTAVLIKNHLQLPKSLRLVIIGGEAALPERVAAWQNYIGAQARLLNTYGATEATIISTIHDLTIARENGLRTTPIGRPIQNVQTYILDKYQQIVPAGVPGELYIGGAGIARGYLNRPNLTAERFATVSLAQNNAPRLYKSGDSARYLRDGTIEYLGRMDSQVKIRGFRVELGEIETALAQHPDIQLTAVTTHTEESGHKRLVAYLVPQGSTKLTTTTLRQFLQQKLPHYMVPSAFVTLTEMPLSPNGKIDRRALPTPTTSSPSLIEAYVAPKTEQEKIIAALWAQVLQVDRVGLYDNFFELGGHSLLATQVISRVKNALGVEFPLRRLFENPTVSKMSTAITQIRHATAVAPPAIEPVPHNKPLPLSFAQERMWFLYQLAPNDSAYHIPVSLRYDRAIDVAALQKSLDAMVIRHESLRTIFPSSDGVPYQVIKPPFTVFINEVDLTNIPADEQETAVIRLLQTDSNKTYNLATAPPWRFTLFCLADDAYVFYFSFHHIIFDQWSGVILWQDLDNFYQAFLKNKVPALTPLDIQYADFAVWQRNWLQGEPLKAMTDYWHRQLADIPVLSMPTDYPRPPIQSYQGATEFLILPDSLASDLHAFSRKSQVSLFMLVFAAFKLLLARYTNQTDIAVGVPIANRHRLEIEPIIGTFVNTLVVRSDLSDNPSFAELLERVRNVLLDAYAHQEMPFEKLVDKLTNARDLSHTPIIQILFNMVNTPIERTQGDTAHLSSLLFDRGAAQFDISVSIILEEHFPVDPQIAVEYNTDLFTTKTIKRFLSHYKELLAAVIAAPQQPISNYEMLTTHERQQLVQKWNQTEMAYPRQSCLHELIAEQVERRPEKTAVIFQDQSLTYRQLDQRSTQLAHHLQTLGVGAETIVGIFVERSMEMVVGLLGILKAGGAYLPLDPAFPNERLAFMVEDAQADIVLTQSSLMNSELAAKVAHPICLDTDWNAISQHLTTPLPAIAKPNHRAYIIYTSGSTGKPKGVQIEHRNAVNFLAAMRKKPGISPDDILYSVTTHSFDISVLEIFLPLTSGACVVIADSLTTADGRAISNALQRYQATIMQATPTTWSMLIDAGWQGTASLRRVLCGGEALSRELANAILERDVELWNMYGPTETTVWSSIHRIQAGSGQIRIGRPIGNTTLYILDPYGHPVPIGVAGELYIGGDGVARGYLNRPKLTAERFLPSPFASNEHERLYRTGDLARYGVDGVVEYLGRTDFQVKVHGHRIELGEIEAALTAYPPAREAVVTVHSHEGDQILVAYMVLHVEKEQPTVTAVRDYLRQSLPDYMIPSAFVYLDTFPLTPNRKVDRKALPAPDSYRPDLDNQYIAPRNDVETILTTILAELLGIEKVGIRDDFFELGGHSLQATRFVARVGEAFRMEMPLWTFLRAPNTIALAEYLANTPESERITNIAALRVRMAALPPEEAQQLLREEEENIADSTPVQRITAVTRKTAVPLTYAQSRIWFLEQMELGGGGILIPTAVRLKIPVNIPLLTESFHYVWQRHTILDALFYEEEGQIWQRAGNFDPPPLSVIDLTHLDSAARKTAVSNRIADNASTPFPPTNNPLIRAELMQLQADESILLLTIHHIISDGWSVQILLREWMDVYVQKLSTQPIALPKLPIQYSDYAHWQQEWLKSAEIARQLTYWKKQLQSPLSITELPTDFTRPAIQTFKGGQQQLTLSPRLTHAILQLTRQTGVTLYMALLTAFKTVLHRHTGQAEIVIGSPIAGRPFPELEPLVGLFLNSLVLRTDFSGAPTFAEALTRVRTTCLDAFANQDIPFEQLLMELNPTRDVSRTPFFQIFFNMLTYDQQPPVGGLATEFVPSPELHANFDITLYLEEVGDGIELTLVYNRDLFLETRMADLLQQYQLLLQQVADNAALPLDRYTLLTDQARKIVPNPAAAISNRWEGAVPEHLDRWAETEPMKTAVSDQNSRWTYRDVAANSNRLAHFLQKQGVQSGDVIAIYGHRCAALVPTIMGIFKAGAATLILDPTYPDLRLIQYLETAEPAGWLHFAAAAPPKAVQQTAQLLTNGRQLSLPEQPADWVTALTAYPDTPTATTIQPDDIASLTFTSGSTGQPKAVMGRHRSLTHFYPWMAEQFNLTPSDRFSMLSGLAHDPLQRDIFTALWVGAEICVPDAVRMWEPAYMAHWLRDAGITVAHLIPSMIHQLTAVNDSTTISTLHHAFFVGEALTRTMVQQLRLLIPNGDIINLYGASETQRAVSYHLVEKKPRKQIIPLGIGMPLGAQLLVLTAQQTVAGIGELGELYMRSPHMAAGYWRDEEKTATMFLPNPASDITGDQLYRTGDYGRFLPDGQVEFAGRVDSQINLRGFRIELGDVETTILSLPTINSVYVTLATDPDQNEQIVAYAVHHDGAEPSTAQEVQAHVRSHLPLPMMPASVIFIDSIPLTPNGKINRKALPEPTFNTTTHTSAIILPRNHNEEVLAAIWRDLLQQPSVSVTDDFFALGGHSILAIQMFSRLRDELGVELNIGLLFQASTIAELAERITQQEDVQKRSPLPSEDSNIICVHQGKQNKPRFFCVHGGGGNVLFMQAWPPYFDGWSIYGLESPSVDGLSWPKSTIEAIAADYVENIQKIQSHGPYLLGGYSGGGALAYEMAQQLQAIGEQIDLLVLMDTHHPSIRPQTYGWQTRIRRFIRQPKQLTMDMWQRKIVEPVRFFYLYNRYAKRNVRAPLAHREPLISYYLASAKRRYQPKRYDGRVLLIRSLDVESAYAHADKQLGWGEVIEDLEVVESPSTHLTLVLEPFVQQMAKDIKRAWTRK